MRRDRAKAYREIDRLKQQVIQQKKMIERYKKRLYRKSQKLKDANSPKTKTKQMLKGQKVNEHVRKTLLFHNVFLQGIKEKYQNAECEKAKQLQSKAFSSKLLRKYRMQKLAKNYLKLTQRRINHLNSDHLNSAPDGVGAVVKREADRAVSHGKDITKAENLIETLNSINLVVKLFLVTDEQISKVDMILKDSTMKTVAGTMKIHQVTQITIKAYTSTSPIQFE